MTDTKKEAEKLRKELGDIGTDNSECVKVSIRCRPMLDREIGQGHHKVVKIDKKRGEVFVSRPFGGDDPKQFTFDLTYGMDEL